MKRTIFSTLPVVLFLAISGCSDWQRVGYETLESVRLQQCRDEQVSGPEWAECRKRISYEDYRRRGDTE